MLKFIFTTVGPKMCVWASNFVKSGAHMAPKLFTVICNPVLVAKFSSENWNHSLSQSRHNADAVYFSSLKYPGYVVIYSVVYPKYM
jgi:hypothetical protein